MAKVEWGWEPLPMFKTLAAIRADARTYRGWFEFVGQTLIAQGLPRSALDLTSTFCEGGADLDGHAVRPWDRDAVAVALVQSLKVFEDCKLLSARKEARFTTNLGLSVPERVAQLTSRGSKVLGLPQWRVEFLFQRFLITRLVQRIWKPFAGAVAVAGTVAGVLKLVLLWKAEQAAVAGALTGVAALVGHLWSSRAK